MDTGIYYRKTSLLPNLCWAGYLVYALNTGGCKENKVMIPAVTKGEIFENT